jgi:electron transfer flavoprotein beta subunit
MNLLVFTKRVPAAQEEELRIIDEGKKVDLSRVPYKVNDWDNYAVEEAVRIAEKTSGSVTAISIGNAESDEVLRRAIAMGGKEGFLIETATVYDDPNARATLACNFLKKESLQVCNPRMISLPPRGASLPPKWAFPMCQW